MATYNVLTTNYNGAPGHRNLNKKAQTPRKAYIKEALEGDNLCNFKEFWKATTVFSANKTEDMITSLLLKKNTMQ